MNTTNTTEVNTAPLYVSGMPLFLRGFNGKHVYDRFSNFWVRDVHYYFGLLIRPTRIRKKEDYWIIEAVGELGATKIASKSNEICGDWTNGIRVSTKNDWSLWWHSNKYALFTGIMVSFVAALVFTFVVYRLTQHYM